MFFKNALFGKGIQLNWYIKNLLWFIGSYLMMRSVTDILPVAVVFPFVT